jgi:Uri superfamily endonuclease
MRLPLDKCSYSIIIRLNKDKEIKVGSLKMIHLVEGFYVYNGSAYGSGGLVSRIKHHLKKRKKLHWHIDYVTSSHNCNVLQVVACKERNLEKRISLAMLADKNFSEIPKFGATDDAIVKSHFFLIKANSKRDAIRKVKKVYKKTKKKNEVTTYLPSFFAI